MKRSLLMVALLAVALSACTKKEETITLPAPATPPSLPAAAPSAPAETSQPAEAPAPAPAPEAAAPAEVKPAN